MMQRPPPRNRPAATALNKTLRLVRPGFVAVAVFSLFINILALVGPLYMMQIYDRVLDTRNLATLAVLTLLVAVLYAVFAALESLRSLMLARVGQTFDQSVSATVFDAVHRANLRQPSTAHAQALRDVDTVRDFFSTTLIALCDLPWVPIYILVATALSPWFGLIAVVTCLISAGLAFANDRVTRDLVETATRSHIAAGNQAAIAFRQAETLHAMGMTGHLRARWQRSRDGALGWQAAAGDRNALLLGLIRYNRLFTQSLILGLGVYLAINREIMPGMIIAASIIVGRSTQPIETAISSWKNLVGTRSAFRRVQDLLRSTPTPPTRMRLPEPRGDLQVENLMVQAPGAPLAILRGVSFAVPAGKVLGIIGPSAAGKSTLARILVGAWQPTAGAVRLDGSEVRHWDPEQFGAHLGYLPQEALLLPGTIAENIARFGEVVEEKVIQAARVAGAHELIQRLPAGYNTEIGETSTALSGGQRQRVALARAVYGLPALVVLDEPNANLDASGDQGLLRAVQTLAEAGRTVVLITHMTNMIGQCDLLLFLKDGVVQSFGPRDEVLAKMKTPRLVATAANAGLKPIVLTSATGGPEHG